MSEGIPISGAGKAGTSLYAGGAGFKNCILILAFSGERLVFLRGFLIKNSLSVSPVYGAAIIDSSLSSPVGAILKLDGT